MMFLNRRGFLGGLTALVAAPNIVRATSLMPIKAIKPLTSPIELSLYGQQFIRFRAESFRDYIRENQFFPYIGDQNALIRVIKSASI
jgi:hypothetical protein